MARTTPRIEQGVLVSPLSRGAPVAVGSQQWFSWLADEGNASFFFSDEEGSFTARKERRKRGGWYWIAYRSRGGKLAKAYIGRNEDLTPARLNEVTRQLSEKSTVAPDGAMYLLSVPSTKFVPPSSIRSTTLVKRSELLTRLDESLQVKLALVVAPAGFGKTTLLSMWYEAYTQQHDENQVIWIALDERDNDTIRFWSCIWNALRGEPNSSRSIDISAPLFSTPQMQIESVLAVLLNGMSKSQRHIVLILDDYHAITNTQIHSGVEFLLAHLPSTVHVILSSRHEPPLSLGRARMYRELIELRANDLRLNADEIGRFLSDSMALTLSISEQEILAQRTEGWVAGLQLVALALRDQPQPGKVLARFTGSQRSLFDYFAEEVFARQPEEVQRFLLSTALFVEFTPQLCATVLAEGPQHEQLAQALSLLEYVERANLFILPLDEQRQRYRYHTLFAEFLQERLRQDAPGLITHLRQRAARWYEGQGLLEEAIEHAIAARDTERAQHLIEQVGDEILWRKGEVRRLLTWLQVLPFRQESASTRLKLLYAWALLMSGQQALQEVDEVLEDIEASEGEAISSHLRGEIAAVRARLAAFRGDPARNIAFSRQALQDLPGEKAMLRADVAFGLNSAQDKDEAYRMLSEALHLSRALGSLRTIMFASRYLAAVCVDQGRLTEAEAIHQQALSMSGKNDRDQVPAAGIVYIGRAELLYERNELTEALRCALHGAKLGEQSGEMKAILSGYYILSMLFAALGDLERGEQIRWKAETLATMGKVDWYRKEFTASAVHHALLLADIDGAKRALLRYGIDAEANIAEAPAIELEIERLMLARIWLAEKKYSEVRALLEPVVAAALRGKHITTLMAAQSLVAAALSGLGEHRQAARLISEALNRAEPEGYMRVFLDLGEPVLALLQRGELSGSARAYARKLLEASSLSDQWRKRYGGLSEREHEVLRLVATGLSNQEIAETLLVAVRTVKAHIRHICHKLGVERRIQAVTKAREIGLL